MQCPASKAPGLLAGGLLILSFSLFAANASAHQFWLQPEDFRPGPEGELSARLLVGEDMKGAAFPYLSHRFERFEIAQAAKVSAVSGTEGQDPALALDLDGAGLISVAYQSRPDRADFIEDWDTFEAYLLAEGLDWVVEAHAERGLSRSAFAELYTRCAKTLVQSGSPLPGQKDVVFGLPFEFVALSNPYAMTREDSLSVQLLWLGQPASGVQVTLLRKAERLEKTTLFSDTQGRVDVPLAGGGEILLSAVHMEALARGEEQEDSEPVWASHWASLSFSGPAEDGEEGQ